jgi:hypothetical protein
MHFSTLQGLNFSGWFSALPAGLGREVGNALFHFCAFALRTGSLGLPVLGNALNDCKFLITIPAFILVCGHVPSPFPWDQISNEIIDSAFCFYLNGSAYIVKR